MTRIGSLLAKAKEYEMQALRYKIWLCDGVYAWYRLAGLTARAL